MTSARLFRLVVRWFITLAVPFLLLMSGVRMLLSYEFLRFEYTRPGFPADPYGFTTLDRLEYGMYAISFLFSAEGDEELARLRLPRDKCWPQPDGAANCAQFNERELGHLADVKSTLTAGFLLCLICLFTALFCAITVLFCPILSPIRQDFLSHILGGLRQGATLTLAIVASLVVIAVAAWDSAFDAFHELFFTAGTWRFPFSDSLIRLYPEQLFIDAAVITCGFAAACSLAILAACWRWAKRPPHVNLTCDSG